MKTKTNQQTNLFKNFGFAGIALCTLCCVLPVAGAVLGIGTLTILSKYFEWAGMAATLFAVAFFIVRTVRKRKLLPATPAVTVRSRFKTKDMTVS